VTTYNKTTVRGLEVFYREAGRGAEQTIVLLHGFPSSSHMFRDLIPKLAEDFHVIAPDYIGFGYSAHPSAKEFQYSFDNLAAIVEDLLFDQLKLKKFSIYVQDYGAPVGFRIASKNPNVITGIVVQNGNAYVEGVSPAFEPIKAFWAERNSETEKPVRALLTAPTTYFQYTHGVRDVSKISPDAYTFDQHFLDRAGNDEVQLALFHNYTSNVALYPEWQAYFRQHQPPTLIVWGQNDPFFTVEGAKAFQRDLPNAELHLLDSGHFALEDHGEAIASHILRFFATKETKKGAIAR
jgi:pimeloyl-ACP methyl ester carboxylesterase